MTDLCLKPNGWQGRVVPLSRAPVSIGRHPDNMIRIHDDGASRFHCVIESDGHGKYIVRDLGSRNGTKVNSVKTAQAILDPGDTIKIGKHEFVVYERMGQPENAKAAAAPALTDSSPNWAKEILSTAEALPPKGMLEESITLVEAGGHDSPVLTGPGDGALGLRLLLQSAFKARATDIHLEPKSLEFNVRMRVDGQMVPIVELPLAVGALLCGLVKNACQVKTAARDAMLDGHFSVKLEDRRVEFRASFTPSVYGQKLVLRILDERGIPHSIEELDLAPYMKQRVKRICEQDHGLLLVCGPTGSGKTTTLYSALREIDRETRNVVTIEDPVEYQIDNVTQIPIDEKKGNSFGSLLRSVLRQDPDVILLGEIRDEETARTAMQAAMTGHVVFSTVHAKDTISAVFRLLDLKTEPYLIANALDMVLAQRLVRVLCEGCKQEMPFTPGQATRLGRFTGGRTTQYAATGCSKCLRTGYRGRRAIFELLDFTDELRDVILRDPTIMAMKKVIETGMFTTLAQSGWKMVAEGSTTLEEVDRVAGQG
jgi:general secretion pathway protein E